MITGGTGLLAGRMAEAVALHGHNVVLVSRNKSATAPAKVKLRYMDWDSRESIRSNCAQVDVIIHTAGMNAASSAADPGGAYHATTVLTDRILSAAVAEKVTRFIYLSTAHVYRSPLTGSITETDCTVNSHPYAASHRAAEDLVSFYSEKHGIKGTTFRLSNGFGAPFHPSADCWMLVINDLCRQAVQDRKLVLHTSGKQRRDFIPISTIIEAVEYAAAADGKALAGKFNLGGEWAPTVLDAAKLVQERALHVLGFSPELHVAADDQSMPVAPLEYSMARLRAAGFVPSDNRIIEIDNLLKFCAHEFDKKKPPA